ncbi:archease [bacterium]|nr:archease [bacterium]
MPDKKNNFKKYETLEYLSDIKLKVYGKSIKEIFRNAAEGMFALITDIKKIEKAVEKNIEITINEKIEIEDLLIIWLEKLLFINEVNSMVFAEFNIDKLINRDDKSAIIANVTGEKINLKKHEILIQIKAPTYHDLNINRNDRTGIFTVEIVFDV